MKTDAVTYAADASMAAAVLQQSSERKPNRQPETLAKFALFQSLDARTIAEIDAKCLWRHYSHNDWIVEHNDGSTDVLFIRSGTVRLKLPASLGREVEFVDFEAGDYFGEVSAIGGQPHVVGLVAVTDVTIARMRAPLFRDMLHAHPDICDQVLRKMAGAINLLVTRVNEFSTLDVRHRIYAELLRLSRPKPGADQSAIISPPPLHGSIAARISTRREAVAREMKSLERAGLLVRNRGSLLITDTKKLQCMIEKVEQTY